jgi:hypothetical protein
MQNFECAPFDPAKWDFRQFAAFLRDADPAFVAQRASPDTQPLSACDSATDSALAIMKASRPDGTSF